MSRKGVIHGRQQGKKARKGCHPAPVAAGADAFAAEVGKLVRRGRAKRGITRRQLAGDSGISERYLAQIESGRAIRP